MHNPKELRDANKRYFYQRANFRAGDLHVGEVALVYETEIEQSHGPKLDAMW